MTPSPHRLANDTLIFLCNIGIAAARPNSARQHLQLTVCTDLGRVGVFLSLAWIEPRVDAGRTRGGVVVGGRKRYYLMCYDLGILAGIGDSRPTGICTPSSYVLPSFSMTTIVLAKDINAAAF